MADISCPRGDGEGEGEGDVVCIVNGWWWLQG
jgi:hypothetical protein